MFYSYENAVKGCDGPVSHLDHMVEIRPHNSYDMNSNTGFE